MQALHFGAGNIGRGFIGKSLLESGFNLLFADIDQTLVDALNHYKEYNIRLVGEEENKTEHVKNVTAIHVNNPKIINIISETNLITTAVGFNVLDKLALIISQGILLKIRIRSIKYLNIIACENKIFASSYLKKIVLNLLPIAHHSYVNEYIGFIDCSVDKIIPSMNFHNKKSLSLVSENFQEWIVDPMQFKGPVPQISNMTLSNNLISFIERKLFTLNTGHAVAAYLGLIEKHTTIDEAIKNEKISIIVKNAMKESGEVLIKLYNFDRKKHLSYINKIFVRFKNPFLLDSLERIARNPIKKLGKDERLIKPLLGTIQYNLSNIFLIKGIAALLHYRNVKDLESVKINNIIQKIGVKKAICKFSGLKIDDKEVLLIASEYYSILKY